LVDAGDRSRLERSGWRVREFSLTTDAVRTLIDKQIPFLLTLVEAGFPQSRLVVGFDAVRETIFFADPYERKPVEAPLAMLIQRYASSGPRGLAAVPPAETARLEGLVLPDAELFDQVHSLRATLQARRFPEAKKQLESIANRAPNHRLTKMARLAFARATGHPYRTLAALNELLADYPRDATLALAKAGLIRELGRIHERLAFLAEHGLGEDADPLLMQSYAQVLLVNPTQLAEADRLLRLSLKLRPHAASGVFLLAAQKWEQGQFDEAIELYRLAACLDDREEQFAEAYVRSAKAVGKLSDAMKLLQRRATRGEVPVPGAVRILYSALLERGEPEFARTALDKAIEKLAALPAALASEEKPDPAKAHAELLQFRAELHANAGRWAEAEADLAASKAHSDPMAWSKVAARIARTRPNFLASVAHLQEVLAVEPLNPDGQRLMIGLLIDTQGRAAARAYLLEQVHRYPLYYPLLKLQSEFLLSDSSEAGIVATQTLLELDPTDAWAHRQLALALSDRRRHEEALAAAMKSGETEADHPSHSAVLANVQRRADRSEDAMATFREGLSKYVDHELAIVELVRTARGLKEKKAALRFVAEQLHRQIHNGDGLVAYRDQSLQLIDDPEEQERFFEELEKFLEERPDLWQAWSLVIQQMVMMHRAEEASALARQATERFPLSSRLWLDLAEACRASNQNDERIEALTKAVETSPGWTQPVKELVDALVEEDQPEKAIAVLKRHIERAPLDPLGYGFLAERLWDAGESEAALAAAERAVRHEPGYDWAWGAVANWGERLDRPDAVVELARSLAQDRSGDARVWMKLARSLHEFEQSEEALAALDRAIALDPTNPDPHDLKAERLADMGRFEEALAAAHPPALLEELPLTLQGRAAWIEARRGNYAAAIPPMQALVSVDPDYYWGWQQLADWYNETGRSEAYLEASSELCRLRPDHPTPLTMRGEAKLQTGDREGGKQDLRDALRIHPGYSPAAAILFDACLADDELKDARSALAVLQEHMAGPEGLVKQIVYAIKTNDEEAAVRAFRSICEHAEESSPTVLQMALMEMKRADWEARAYEQMGEAWRSGEPFNPWAGLLWLDTPPAEMSTVDDRLAACRAVLKQYPQFVPAHDRLAEQLARAGQFEDALVACEPPGIQPLPITLRGRAAWIVALRGDRNAAIDLMRKAVADDPDYTWGWRQITHWTDDLGRHKDCLEAAEQLVRLAPEDPYSFGIRGEAKRILGDHRGARDDYQKAYELDPTFEAAGQQLINEQLATDDLTGAASTLARLREHSDGPLLKLRAVQLAARQKNLALARSTLRSLILDETSNRSLLRDAAKALDDEGWSNETDDEFQQLLQTSNMTAAAAGLWVERLVAAGQAQKVSDELKSLVEQNAVAGREAILVYAWGLVQTGSRELAATTVQRFAETLRQSPESWARAGAILAEARKYPLAIAWLSDFSSRENLAPWMLQALADSHRALGDDDAAQGAYEAAEQLEDEDELPTEILAWLALYSALDGKTDEANDYLEDVDRVGLPDATRLVLALADGLVLVQEASAGEKALAFSEAKEEWKTAAGACAAKDVPVGLGRIYRRCVARLVSDVGGLRAKTWGWRQKFSPWVKEPS
jgi:predicted Zn-dependent protease